MAEEWRKDDGSVARKVRIHLRNAGSAPNVYPKLIQDTRESSYHAWLSARIAGARSRAAAERLRAPETRNCMAGKGLRITGLRFRITGQRIRNTGSRISVLGKR